MPARKSRTRSRKSKNFVAIPFNGTLALTTIANKAVKVDDALGGALTEDLFVISSDLIGEIQGLTPGEGEPSIAGFSHGDYDVTEIGENLNVTLLGPGTKIEQERARRLVRKAGSFLSGGGTNVQTNLSMIGRDGSRISRTKLNFVVQSGKTFNVWLQNLSEATFTTGAILVYSGTLYGRWIL